MCTNTGELYELDLFEKGENPDAGEYGYMSFGYDEVSQTSLHITKTPGNKKGTVTVQIWDYELRVEYEEGDYEIEVRYIKQVGKSMDIKADSFGLITYV